ncbi:hypothetical protein [Streptomyces noursei]|uniref:hypothetical protein n=1 Tax=Streptomyces noursei TaxID=1971 RepID=UPI0016735832|nr:hypothetical protein [Streptomyces noursei]MCZ1021109.1 hypothetical protein [Streptomyces noursei]MCZ1021140.1 hypothetical protein [Streptomyces noursei]MCZ1021465.1 hypothetical protein [Streptomyces noursei]GGX51443.1 hypothetical protein GCM10010341_86180 [Streptomyces noursei]
MSASIPAGFTLYDWIELVGFAWKVENEGYHYAAEHYAPEFETEELRALVDTDDPRPLSKAYEEQEQALQEWQEATGPDEADRLWEAHLQEQKERREAHLPWGLHPGGDWNFAPYSKAFATREEVLEAIKEQNARAEQYENFLPFTGRLLHRTTPRGEWTEVPLPR